MARWRYDDWIKIGYVIKSVVDNDEGKALWLQWSGQFPEKATEKPDRMWERGLKRPRVALSRSAPSFIWPARPTADRHRLRWMLWSVIGPFGPLWV